MAADDDIGPAGPVQGTHGAPEAAAAAGHGGDLSAVQATLIKEIDVAIARLENAPADAATREHLEVLRTLLTAQVTAYLEHIKARRAKLFPHTSVMYAGDVAPLGVLSTTLGRGRPRLAAIWDIAGLEKGKLVLREVDTGAPAASELAAET